MTVGDEQETDPSHTVRARALASCLMVALILLFGGSALANESGRAVPADLLQKAWTQGTVRVIVELGGVGAVPEGHLLSHAAVAAQRGRIASDRAALRVALRGLRHHVLREFKTIPYVGLEVDHDALRALDALPGLATRVHEDILLRPTLAQSGPLIKAPDAWAASWDGTGQVIAIIDTGVDKNHPFLTGKIVEEACYDSSGVSTCPAGSTEQTGSGAGLPCTYAPGDCEHGTHVAGIAAGNGSSFDGVARGASLMAVRVFHLASCGGAPCALASTMDIVSGLERVYELREARDFGSVNMSLGGDGFTGFCDGFSPSMTAAIANLRSVGIPTIVSSGNDGFLNAISFPACISTAISVGATSDGSGGGLPADLVMAFSNSAYFLSLLAPGYLINSSIPGGGFANFSGTSMAAPHVAGVWAIAKQANPAESVDDVLSGIVNTGKPIFDPGNGITFARVAATVLQFSASAYSVSETGTVTITVTRSGGMFGPHFAPLTVDYATSPGTAISGQDYTETSGTLTFNPGEISKTFTVQIVPDSKDDGSRTVNLALTNPGGGALLGMRDGAVLTIGDDDVAGSIQFSASTFSVGEQAGIATITVNRSGGSAGDVTVQYTTSNGTAQEGTDYQIATGPLTFGPGEMSRTFQVTILLNGTVDGNRTVNLTLHTPAGGAVLGGQKTAVLTIVDDEIALQFSQANYSVNEGTGSVTITVTRSGPAGPAVGVTYRVLPGSATAGADYGGGDTVILQFAANQTTRSFTIPIVNDTLAEGSETVLLQLSSPTGPSALLGARQSAVLTIVDNDAGGAFKFGSASYGVGESSAVANVTVVRSGGAASNGQVRLVSVGGSGQPGIDYVAVDQVLTFPAGQVSQTVPVTLLTSTNTVVDGPRTIHLALQSPAPAGMASLGSPTTATVTISNNDLGGMFQWSPASVTVLENVLPVTATLTVTRTGGLASAVGVTWTITGGTASLDSDYGGPTSGVLTFDAGQTSQPVTIPLLNPAGAEGTRTVQVTLNVPTGGAGLGSAKVATLTLLDDEVGFRFSQLASSVSEANSSATLTVLRTGPAAAPASAPVSIDYTTVPGGATPSASPTVCTPGGDYRPVTGTLTFLPGQTIKTFLVPLCGDSFVEGPETLTLVLSNPSPPALLSPPGTATLTITENDLGGVLKFSSAAYSASETQPSVTLTVARTAGAAGGVTVDWTLTDQTALHGTDYAGPQVGTLTFAPGQSSASFTIPLLNDLLADGPRTVLAQLASPQGGATLGTPATAVVTIADDEPTLRLSSATYVVSEATASAIVTVLRGGPTTGPVTATLVPDPGPGATGGTCGAGNADFANASLPVTFAPGQNTRTVALPLCPDTLAEGTEPFTVHLADPVGASLTNPSTATITLQDNDLGGTLQWSPASVSILENVLPATATLTVTRTGGLASAVGVAWAITGGSAILGTDYAGPTSGVLAFDAGQLSQSVLIPLLNPDGAEGTRTVQVTLSPPTGGAGLGTAKVATLTLLDDEIGFRFSQLASSVSEANPSATIVVLRTGPAAAPVSIDYTTVPGSATPSASPTLCTPDADYRPVSGTLTFLPGQTIKTFLVPLCGDSLVEGDETLSLVLSNPSAPALLPPPGTATLTITENDLGGVLRFSSAAYSASETQLSVTLTVTRTAGATGGVTVDWTLTDQTALHGTDYAGPQAGTLTFAPGQLSRTVTIPLLNDLLGDGPRTVLAQLALPQGGAALGTPATAVVTIADNEPTLRLSSATYIVSEGSTVLNVTVLSSSPASAPLTVELVPQQTSSATGGTCSVDGADFGASVIPVTLIANQTSKTVQVPLCGDMRAEGTESFGLQLQNPVGAMLANPATATVTLTDNEVAGTLQWSVADAIGVEGATLVLTVTRTGGTASDVTVQVTAHDGDTDTPGADAQAGVDYEILTLSPLTFGPNATSQTVEISLLPIDGPQGPRAFRVILHDVEGGAALGNPSTVTVWILDPS